MGGLILYINVDRTYFLKSDLNPNPIRGQGQWAVLENNASVTIISIKVFSPELHGPDPAMVVEWVNIQK